MADYGHQLLEEVKGSLANKSCINSGKQHQNPQMIMGNILFPIEAIEMKLEAYDVILGMP